MARRKIYQECTQKKLAAGNFETRFYKKQEAEVQVDLTPHFQKCKEFCRNYFVFENPTKGFQ